MNLDEIMRRSNFNNLSRDQLVQICYLLKDQVKFQKNIINQKIDRDYEQIKQLQIQLNDISNKLNKANKVNKSIFKNISAPLTMKERWSGKFDISKVNKPDIE